MIDDLLQSVLAAKNKGPGGWIRLLPLVFVAVYVISGIVKAKSAEGKDSDEDEDRGDRLRYKPLDSQQSRQIDREADQKRYMPLDLDEPEESSARQPSIAAQVMPERDKRLAYPVQPARRPIPQRQAAPTAKQVRPRRPVKRKSEVQLKAQEEQKKPSPKTETHRPAAGLLDQLAGKDNLKRAILYSEILGKPIALRDI